MSADWLRVNRKWVPDLLGPALAILAGLVLLLFLIVGATIAIARRYQRHQDADRS